MRTWMNNVLMSWIAIGLDLVLMFLADGMTLVVGVEFVIIVF
jgi:hypothetical protein